MQNPLIEKILKIQEKYLKPDAVFNLEKFQIVMNELRPEVELEPEQLAEVFASWDCDNVGIINSDEVAGMLQNLIIQDATNIKSPTYDNENSPYQRQFQSIYYRDALEKKFANLRISQIPKNKKIGHEILESLSLEKIAQLKNIYDICDQEKKGEITMKQVETFIKTVNTLEGTPDEIISIFNFIKDDKTNKISKEVFCIIVGELERKIFTAYQKNYMDKPSTIKKQIQNEDFQLNIHHSEIEEDEYDTDEEDTIEASTDNGQKYAIKSLKLKNNQLSSLLNDILKSIKEIDDKLKSGLEKDKKQVQKIHELEAIEDFLKTRIASLEEESKRFHMVQENLFQQNDDLRNEHDDIVIECLEEEKVKLLKRNDDLIEQTREVIILETKLAGWEKEKSELLKTIKKLEDEKLNLKEDFNQLEQLYSKLEKNQNNNEKQSIQNDTKDLEKVKYDFEINQREKNNLMHEIQDLNEKLLTITKENALNKELITTLKLEKSDLKNKCINLEEECESLKKENNIIRTSVFRKSNNISNLGYELSGCNFQSIFRGSQFRKYQPFGWSEESYSNKTSFLGGNIPHNLKEIDEEEERVQNIVNKPIPSFGTCSFGIVDNEMNMPQNSNKKNTEIDLFENVEIQPANLKPINPIKTENNNNNEIIDEKVIEDKNTIKSNVQNMINMITTSDTSYKDRINDLFLAIDEQINLFARDYLSLRDKPAIIKMLSKYKEEKLLSNCYSDYMIRINGRENKEKRAMLITTQAFYNLHPKKNFQVMRRIPLESIYKITICEKSAVLCAIHVKSDYDYLIETYKRPNMILYLMEAFKSNKLPMFQISFESGSFAIKNRGMNKPKDIKEFENSTIFPELQSVYKNVTKLGFLYYLTDSWWTPWKQYFFILGDLGLMVFKKPGQRDPIYFFPIIGYCTIIENPKFVERNFSFKILYPEGDNEVILAANSQSEKVEWLKAIYTVEEKNRKKVIQEREIKSINKGQKGQKAKKKVL